MSIPAFTKLRPDETVTAERFNEIVDWINTNARGVGTENTEVIYSVLGPTTRDYNQPPIWAQIGELAYTGSYPLALYAFNQVQIRNDDVGTTTLTADEGGVIGDGETLQALEINGRHDADTRIQQLIPSPFQGQSSVIGDSAPFLQFRWNPPAVLAQCDNAANGGGAVSTVQTVIPLGSVKVNMPQDSQKATYLVISEVDFYIDLPSPSITPDIANYLNQNVDAILEVYAIQYDTSPPAAWPTLTDDNLITRRYNVIKYERDIIFIAEDGGGLRQIAYSQGSPYAHVTATCTFDADTDYPVVAASPTGGIFADPDVTLVCHQLRVTFVQNGNPTPDIDIANVVVENASVKVIKVDKVAADAHVCGPVGDIDPPPPPPPGSTHLVAITITTAGGGGTILGGVQVTVTDSGAVVEDVTVTPAKLPYTYYLYLTNDTYTVTAEYAATGTPMTVTPGSFTVAGADMSTTQDVT